MRWEQSPFYNTGTSEPTQSFKADELIHKWRQATLWLLAAFWIWTHIKIWKHIPSEIELRHVSPLIHKQTFLFEASWVHELEKRLNVAWEDFNGSLNETNRQERLVNFHLPGSWSSKHNNPQSKASRSLILATHLSVDKVSDRLSILLEFWRGPASIAIYITEKDQIKLLANHFKELRYAAESFKSRKISETICLHFLLESSSKGGSYPHNILRNMAMQYPNSHGKLKAGAAAAYREHDDFVLAVDADFIPSWDAHGHLSNLLLSSHSHLRQKLNNHTVFVLPVFNLLNEASGQLHPSNVKTLRKSLPTSRTGLVHLYQEGIAQEWPYKAGHQSSNYTVWLKRATRHSGYQLNNSAMSPEYTFPIVPSKGYEPFFVASRLGLPKYWEGFRGFALNKESFVAEVILRGYQFEVFYDLYLMHLSHTSNHNDTEREKNIVEWQKKFKPYLRKAYPNPLPNTGKFKNLPFLQG